MYFDVYMYIEKEFKKISLENHSITCTLKMSVVTFKIHSFVV